MSESYIPKVNDYVVWDKGEYGIDDSYLGVPVILGSNGIEKVIELNLNQHEKKLLEKSRKHVKEVMSVLENL